VTSVNPNSAFFDYFVEVNGVRFQQITCLLQPN